MTDHSYCDNENLIEFTENYESKYVISMSDDPDYEEVRKSGPQTRLKSKIKLEQSQTTWAPVRTAPGLRPNCMIFYDGNGFAYHNHKIANNKKYLKCTQKSIKKKPCPARAVIRNYDNMIRHSGELHTHNPRNYDEDLLKRNFLMKIRERAINENTPNRKIFDEEIKKSPKLKGKVSFSSTARRMQRFRQPQKVQGPLFPIEDDELINAINDYKSIPADDINYTKNDKSPVSFDEFNAENHMEVIEIDDIYSYSNEIIHENETLNEKDDKENISKNILKETEKTVNMFCCIYCNKWQEAQIFEFVPNQKSKTMELKEKIEKTSEELLPPTDCSSPITNPISSENLTLKNDQNTTLGYSGIHKNISQNNDVSTKSLKQDDSTESLKQDDSTESLKQDDSTESLKQDDSIESLKQDFSKESLKQDDSTESLKQDDSTESLKQDSMNMHSYTSDPETDNLEKPRVIKTLNQENKKKSKRKGFLQMRIDSTIYFDSMGYSYQIQNEKNDKKYLRCVVWGKKKCPGRAHLNKKNSNIVRSRGHNHLPSTNCDAEKQARAFLHAIKGRAQEEITPLRTIYEEEILKFPLAAAVVNYANATRRMQRTRRLKNQPNSILEKEPPLLLSVQVIPGTRRGTSLYMDELGYYYHNDSLTNSGKVVRCTKNRKTTTEEACHSRGLLRPSGDGFVIYRTKDHNHPPGDLKRNPMERSFINTLCERARNDLNLGLKDIYNQEVQRFLDVADKIPYRMAWRSMARTRQPLKSSGDVKVVRVLVVSGLWEGYTLYRDEIGFLYSLRKGRKYVWCHMNTKLKCLVKGSISFENDASMLEYTGEHNHPPLDDDEFQAAIFIEKIMLRCLNNDSKPKKLYEEELINYPGVENRVSLAYAREKIKARRKSSLKKHSAHETMKYTCEPLQFVEFWNDEHNISVKDEFTEDIIYSEDEDFNDEDDPHNVYSDEQGFKYSVVSVKDKTRFLECIKKQNECKARGEMFRGENGDWLFVLHDFTHNHLPHED